MGSGAAGCCERRVRLSKNGTTEKSRARSDKGRGTRLRRMHAGDMHPAYAGETEEAYTHQ